jgi:endoglucanase
MKHLRWMGTLGIAAVWGVSAWASPFGRGVNILGYDPIWKSPEQARFRAEHMRAIREAGFQHVRVNLHPFHHMGPDLTLSSQWWNTLDWVVGVATSNGLAVVLDCHEFQAMGRDLDANRPRFLAFWRQMAERLRDAPDSVAFELLNEPHGQLTPARWNELLVEALSIVRAQQPNRTVVLGPAQWNSVDGLAALQLPENDRHIVLTIHYYEPMDFTHQGAAWAGRKEKVGVAWNGLPEEVARIEQDFERVAAWASARGRPVYLGEFGVYDAAPMESRKRYLSAVARAAERRGWSWAYWQFDSDFVVWDMARNQWVEPVLRALIPPPIRVLVTYGGHGFQQREFWAMWDSFADMRYTRCELPREADLLRPGPEQRWDVIVRYDMVADLSPEHREALIAQLRAGVGLVSLHHNFAAHPTWEEYVNIRGGAYILKPRTVRGMELPASWYAHDQDVRVTIADREHPITRGLKDYTIHDEVYGGCYIAPSVHVLLTTDHPRSMSALAWTTSYERARVVFLQHGHDAKAWEHPMFREILQRSIRWAAGQL